MLFIPALHSCLVLGPIVHKVFELHLQALVKNISGEDPTREVHVRKHPYILAFKDITASYSVMGAEEGSFHCALVLFHEATPTSSAPVLLLLLPPCFCDEKGYHNMGLKYDSKLVNGLSPVWEEFPGRCC